MADRHSSGAELACFILGIAVGATVALLYAPQSGRRTRRYLEDRAEEGKDKITDAAKDVVHRGRDLYEKGREVADEVADLFDRGRNLVGG